MTFMSLSEKVQRQLGTWKGSNLPAPAPVALPAPVVVVALAVSAAPGAVTEPRTFDVGLTTQKWNALAPKSVIKCEVDGLIKLLSESRVIAQKGNRDLFSPGRLKTDLIEGNITTKEGVSTMQMVALDCDVSTPQILEATKTKLAGSGVYYVLYHTYSSTPEKPKFRVVLPLAGDYQTGDHETVHSGLENMLALPTDQSANRNFGQRMYLASQPVGTEATWPAPISGGTRCATYQELMARVMKPPAPNKSRGLVPNVAPGGNKPDSPGRDFTLIAQDCAVVRAMSVGELEDEPTWRNLVGIYKNVSNGNALYHQHSALWETYNKPQVQGKWDGFPETMGPTTCKTLNSSRCDGCPSRGLITSPIQLASPASKQGADPKAIAAALKSSGIEPLMDPYGRLFITKTSVVNTVSVRKLLPADSLAANDMMAAATYAATGKAPSKLNQDTAIALARHEARESGERVDIALRVAEAGGAVYKDHGPGRVVKITNEAWALVDDAALGVPMFMRSGTAGEIPDPVSVGTPRAALTFLLQTLQNLHGLLGEQALIVIATLLDWHRTSTPYPIIEVTGPAGCGKSTLCDAIASLIDPSGDGGRVTVGTGVQDIAAAAQGAHLIRIDNASRPDAATSNLFCMVSTGATLMVRLLYAQSETANLKVHRALLVNAVSPVLTAPDLQTRVNRIELHVRRGGYTSENELRSVWAALLPKLHGALYDLMVGTLRELPAVRAAGPCNGHRLVDFDQLGVAMVRAAGLEDERFTKPVAKMRERMARVAASGDLFLMALVRVLRDLAAKPTHTDHVELVAVARGLDPALAVVQYDQTRIRITVRPETLHRYLPQNFGGLDRNSAMPATARGLTDAIRRVQPLLGSMGLNTDERTARGRTVLCFDFDQVAVNET